MKPCGDAWIWQCSVLMKPSLTTMSAGGAVPIFVPPERRRNVWYALLPLSGTSQPTTGNPSSLPLALNMTVLTGPIGFGASAGAAAATGIGIGIGTSFFFEAAAMMMISSSSTMPPTMMIQIGNPPFFGGDHTGASTSGTASLSSLSILTT